tara:strand:- start:7491 stop:7685 length:195 start_codon:yes stop_codon:yes gene_type:complete
MPHKKHPYDDGEIIKDTEKKEVFFFSNRRHGFKAETKPSTLRPATEEEKERLDESGQDLLKLNF